MKNATFVKGVCQDDLLFVTDNGKVGMCRRLSDSDAIQRYGVKASRRMLFLSFLSDIITPTLREVYLGTLQYYTFDPGRNNYYGYILRLYYY